MNDKLSVKFVTDRQTDRQTEHNSVLFLLQKYILHLVNFVLTLYNLLRISPRLVINLNFNIFIKGV